MKHYTMRLSRCIATTNGDHSIDWCDVPASIMNPGMSDEVVLYGGHRRGFCWHCDETFIDGI